ncbi:hypothetical protein Val02_01790 [Virgisporangium aliadipatigenens]|uniref:DUF3558 domain-containing protein n=1 Tax=Virgisporangium aliadipatigenens TaxID=741659 RepID=A0A8J3YFG7_9ACTN|nr:DUF3558 family protein [Virgisporangium aliadipatigenens]GIJ43293.1 hypothetical protein Val02_01790 [Virgisporangium aliadipatigenens]
MNIRSPFRRGLVLAALTAAGLVALSGCDIPIPDTGGTADPTPSATTSAAPTPSGNAAKPSTSAKAAGLPDVCALLTKAEVSALAGGKQVTQVDPDGAAPDAGTRHCQWQLAGARLAIFLSPTTPSEFKQAHQGHTAVPNLGDEAVLFSGHLYVRKGRIVADVYATSGDEAAGERFAKAAAQKILPKI